MYNILFDYYRVIVSQHTAIFDSELSLHELSQKKSLLADSTLRTVHIVQINLVNVNRGMEINFILLLEKQKLIRKILRILYVRNYI